MIPYWCHHIRWSIPPCQQKWKLVCRQTTQMSTSMTQSHWDEAFLVYVPTVAASSRNIRCRQQAWMWMKHREVPKLFSGVPEFIGFRCLAVLPHVLVCLKSNSFTHASSKCAAPCTDTMTIEAVPRPAMNSPKVTLTCLMVIFSVSDNFRMANLIKSLAAEDWNSEAAGPSPPSSSEIDDGLRLSESSSDLHIIGQHLAKQNRNQIHMSLALLTKTCCPEKWLQFKAKHVGLGYQD